MKHLFDMPDGVYLLSHSVGCMPKTTKQTMTDYLCQWQHLGGDAWPSWLQSIADFKQALAELLGANVEQICPQTNLSSGLSKYLLSRPVLAHKNKILMHANAFPSMGFVAQCMQQAGYHLKLINEDLSAIDPDIWRAHLSDDIAIALVTHVHSNTGLMSPVAEIAALMRQHHVTCAVDIAQSAGVVPINLCDWQADIVLGSCVKWLCGGPGAGFMWVNPQHIDELKPMDVGWFSHQSPFEFDIRHFEYAKGSDRFWGGTPAVLPFAIAANSIKTIADIGVTSIWQHNLSMRNRVCDALESFLPANLDISASGGTLCLPFSGAACSSVAKALERQKVRFDRRDNSLRLSFHVYNDAADADELGQIVLAALK